MIRPIWAGVAGLALLGISGGVGVLIASSGGQEEAGVQQAETASAGANPKACDSKATAAGTKLWRWGSAVVEVPEGLRAVGQSKQGGLVPVLELYPEEDPDHGITVDADTGVITKVQDDDSVAERESELQAAHLAQRYVHLIALWRPGRIAPGSRIGSVRRWAMLPICSRTRQPGSKY